ncbi:metallophosphoesterase family protein [Pseudofrankia inefficax]|uniref:Metallophosphoesterase n=1 Tax=Pseudofrankia inefficax (strain DSM 45817 / CECT 9037 / DDB 130130 / EuI1c) TaxID=298654 RepID=E3J3Y8_PSEI1|nr:metallophosphoesterase [Pseudofrankia inefficax]ADP80621.1 metallophosphoesterase [Pseudofrankia inefficax]
MQIAQISDTHLTHRGGLTETNLRCLIAYLNEVARPDVVVITGDIQVMHPDDADDRAYARSLAGLLDVPFRAVPGNHDVGEPAEHPWAGLRVTDERVTAFEATWGPSYWREDGVGAVLLGVNSELLGSGLAAEARQWAWLERTVAELPTATPVLLFLHKPLWPVLDEPTEQQLDVDPVARDRLLALLDAVALRAVGSGHLHTYRQRRRGQVIEVWAPSTAFVITDEHERRGGLGEIGYVEYLVGDGVVEANFRSIPGLTRTPGRRIPQVAAAADAALAAPGPPTA